MPRSHHLVFTIASSLASCAHAQWTSQSLHPASFPGSSWIEGGARGHLTGRVEHDQTEQAALWDIAAAQCTLLHPATATYSAVRAADANTVFGRARFDLDLHAAAWSGDASTFLDLNPSFAQGSEIYSAHGGLQAGYFYTAASFPQAALWSGAAETCASLNPPSAIGSIAFATAGPLQAGFAIQSGIQCAGFWSGTADSWQSLHPQGAHASIASAIDLDPLHPQDAIIAGFIQFEPDIPHAAIWRTDGQWIDLHDPAYLSSQILAAADGYQVGIVRSESSTHASLWHSAADLRLDLHAILPDTYSDSVATAVWIDHGVLHVAGHAYSPVSARSEAMLWSYVLPCPSDFDHSGFVDGDDFSAFIISFDAGDAAADFDQSGFVDTEDFTAFITAFESGC
ncbi:MAG TPA: GC-type dockerin domain-anchored protein [Phycisphaerales bacterium]|nr:GC-type dockerin domain-anchored protein [Phycisphaerales bacterium]